MARNNYVFHYKGFKINVKKRVNDGKVQYLAKAQINRPDAGAYPEWHNTIQDALHEEYIYIDNILADKYNGYNTGNEFNDQIFSSAHKRLKNKGLNVKTIIGFQAISKDENGKVIYEIRYLDTNNQEQKHQEVR